MTTTTRNTTPARLLRRSARTSLGALILTGTIAAGAALTAAAGSASAADLVPGRTAIPGSFRPSTDADTGEFTSSSMTVEIVLAPSNAAALAQLLSDVYNPQSANYHQWLQAGEFYSRFAPSSAVVAAVTSYLQSSGLTVLETSSPFLLRVNGPSSTLEAALSTSIHNYRNARGVSYFANTSAVALPTAIAASVLGVVGVTNTVRLHPHLVRRLSADHGGGPPSAGCETPYVTAQQLFNLVNNGTGFPYGYGAGPGCSGLTPSQTNSIYGAPSGGSLVQGLGVNLAVFELSAYQRSDIEAWAQTFYGKRYTAPLVDVIVDGGPLNPICPTGDECPPQYEGYSGDIEVDADIEMSLTIAPAANHILVYNAPNDYTGQTELDEYSRIAEDDTADVVSSSWGECENDSGAAYVQAENLIFEQLALQGQSVFSSAGDTGAFDCIRSDGTTIVNMEDPATQPWVTSVGGTSLESFNPGLSPFPQYPSGVETVWNVDDLCNASANEGGFPGFFWCAEVGAGGGGSSQFWGRPGYQSGPGITNPFTTYGNGTTQCALAPLRTPCREVPDVSANADPYTGYAEYCTGSASTPYSVCATFSAEEPSPGWFQIGGTSLSSPLWSAVIGDRDGFWRGRIGNANSLLYALYRSNSQGYFNDITGRHQSTNNNGLYPTTPGYDLATGIGTPKLAPLITGFLGF
ncbi:MAG TPA: S53 family peptidase [Steroidobacteraceae bacterium]|nr:S53 family peptidase [Steroidobacteraceae bacterium]